MRTRTRPSGSRSCPRLARPDVNRRTCRLSDASSRRPCWPLTLEIGSRGITFTPAHHWKSVAPVAASTRCRRTRRRSIASRTSSLSGGGHDDLGAVQGDGIAGIAVHRRTWRSWAGGPRTRFVAAGRHVDEHRRHRVLGARVSRRRARSAVPGVVIDNILAKERVLTKTASDGSRGVARRANVRGEAHRRRPPRRRAREPGRRRPTPLPTTTPPGSASVAPWRRRRSPDPRCTPCASGRAPLARREIGLGLRRRRDRGVRERAADRGHELVRRRDDAVRHDSRLDLRVKVGRRRVP